LIAAPVSAGSLIVGLDGLDGSGKSRLAAALAGALTAAGRPATLLRVDDFRRPLDFAGLDPEAESALYYDRYYDFAALEGELDRRRAGAGPEAAILIEGVMLLRARLPAETRLVVLEVSPAEARRRIQGRDQAKGRTPEEVARRIERRYFPAHARYRAAHDPVARAHALIDNEDWRRPRLVRCDPGLPEPLAAALGAALGAAAA
jgi:uridine kinase